MASQDERKMFELYPELQEWYEKWLASRSIPFQATESDVMTIAERLERRIEYDEYVIAYPKNLTSEDLSANHVAGLPLTREHIVRCKDCRWAKDAPIVEGYHLDCALRPLSRHYTRDEDFCSHGEER